MAFSLLTLDALPQHQWYSVPETAVYRSDYGRRISSFDSQRRWDDKRIFDLPGIYWTAGLVPRWQTADVRAKPSQSNIRDARACCVLWVRPVRVFPKKSKGKELEAAVAGNRVVNLRMDSKNFRVALQR